MMQIETRTYWEQQRARLRDERHALKLKIDEATDDQRRALSAELVRCVDQIRRITVLLDDESEDYSPTGS